MNTKRSLAVLLAFSAIFFISTRVAFADEALSETVPATEQLTFDPLLFATVLLSAITVSAVVVSIVFGSKYKNQRSSICHNYACQSNPQARLENEGLFDYRLIETPEEFKGLNHAQSDYVVEEALKNLAAQNEMTRNIQTQQFVHEQAQETLQATSQVSQEVSPRKTYVSKHQKTAQEANKTVAGFTPSPRITLLPNPAKQEEAKRAAYANDVPQELEFLLRKIS